VVAVDPELPDQESPELFPIIFLVGEVILEQWSDIGWIEKSLSSYSVF